MNQNTKRFENEQITAAKRAGSTDVVRPLFLYLKSNKPSAKELGKIETAGYVPVAVESFESVKIVEPTFPISADIDLLTREAFSTISKYPHAGIRELFGKRVADAIAV